MEKCAYLVKDEYGIWCKTGEGCNPSTCPYYISKEDMEYGMADNDLER